ncbi:ankyrin repeat-containing domain protein [Lophiotrema nucula]|uniref:Ankyrin repeat-containing domain protein n=1 Tax=Lophiotrema nucula TaxID=690887 RepID=A0A6A5ZMU6_9PLEO|nr:ankyrin repeat-containing domain protein [Lophiotrema nucula]
MLATMRGYDDVADLLLSNGAGVQYVDNQDRSALHLAVLHGRDRLLAKLLQNCKGNGAIINGYAKDGRMPLHIAIDMGFEAAVELLLESGADVHHKARTL